MYEAYFGFAEKPFSLTPDPKYLYRSQSHADAFELLQYAVARREGFVVVTGDIGTGKTTLCRALLEQIDRTTFTALVLNPFLSEEDLLKRILQDFGVVSRENIKAGQLAGVSKQELIEALYDFLIGLIPLKASAMLIIDEAQNLPLPVLEQIRILSNLETDKEKLLQIVLVGQLNLGTLLKSPGLRQLDQRVSIRYELEPLDRETVGHYIAHRLTIAGGSAAVTFAPRALDAVHRLSGGIPRLINLMCDRALLAAFSARVNRVSREMVVRAADSLDLRRPSAASRGAEYVQRRGASLVGAGAFALVASAFAVSSTAYLYQRFADPTLQAAGIDRVALTAGPAAVRRGLPADAALTVRVATFPSSSPTAGRDVNTLAKWLEDAGYPVYIDDVDLGARGRWQEVFAGTYTDLETARRAAGRLNAVMPSAGAQVVKTGP
jgi:type II secretory pathway predicted ATPase ExeA